MLMARWIIHPEALIQHGERNWMNWVSRPDLCINGDEILGYISSGTLLTVSWLVQLLLCALTSNITGFLAET